MENINLNKINAETLFDSLKENGINVDEMQQRTIENKINEIIGYVPKIGVLGKTGVGKSSLCNALFGSNVCSVNDVASCTRDPQEVTVNIGSENNGITLVDVPGAGESPERDQEYADLYAKLLPELDVILWVLKADDRAFAADQNFYGNVVKPHVDDGKPFFFVLNQVDKVEPLRKWNDDAHEPSEEQLVNIEKKIRLVADFFHVAPSKIIPVSAVEKYNLVTLVNEIVYAVPPEKKITVYRNISEEFRTESTGQHISDTVSNFLEGFVGNVVDVAVEVIGGFIGGVIKGFLDSLKTIFKWF